VFIGGRQRHSRADNVQFWAFVSGEIERYACNVKLVLFRFQNALVADNVAAPLNCR
jgi:hypothetical protein